MWRWRTASMWQNWEPKKKKQFEGLEKSEEEIGETDRSLSCGRRLLWVLLPFPCFLLNDFNFHRRASDLTDFKCDSCSRCCSIWCVRWCFSYTVLTCASCLYLCFQINLRLILVSGKTKEFLFSPNDSAADIAKHVYDNWPMGEWLLLAVAVDKEVAVITSSGCWRLYITLLLLFIFQPISISRDPWVTVTLMLATKCKHGAFTIFPHSAHRWYTPLLCHFVITDIIA